MSSRQSRVLTDHDEIREWVESRGGCPAEVKRTARGDRTGIIRIDFPGYSGQTSLREISWDDFFSKFDDNDLALVVQDTTARGQRSNFNKLVGRETAGGAEPRRARRRTEAGTSRKTSRKSTGARSTTSAGGTSRRTTSGARKSTGTSGRGGSRSTGGGGTRKVARGRNGTTARARTGERRAEASTSARTRGTTARKTSRNGSGSSRGASSRRGRGSRR